MVIGKEFVVDGDGIEKGWEWCMVVFKQRINVQCQHISSSYSLFYVRRAMKCHKDNIEK
jgi:hypothetical protein